MTARTTPLKVGRRLKTNRGRDPEATKRDILEVATADFARNGLSGARIDEIAERTRTSKRMIYYYFGGKDGLYLAVLEHAYSRIRRIEAGLNIDHLSPTEALARLVEFTFDYQNEHEDFVRLVMIENIHHASYLKKSKAIRSLNVTAIDKLKRLYLRGVREGVFRADLDPIDLHWAISALSFFNVSNRATFSNIFERGAASPQATAARRRVVVDLVRRYVAASAG
jgi:AcrR family transcriptional regulator